MLIYYLHISFHLLHSNDVLINTLLYAFKFIRDIRVTEVNVQICQARVPKFIKFLLLGSADY